MKKNILDYSYKELEQEVVALGEPSHRATQIFSWLYKKCSLNFKEMTDLSKNFITKLEENFYICVPKCVERLVSKDGTEKFLWRLDDGAHIESVFIKEKDRRTLCISTQVGCKFGCPFCASGTLGFKRNLKVFEITGQILSAEKAGCGHMTNIVFMGMGEPLDNYANLMKAIRIINNPKAIGLGARKITVSTSGLVPEIAKLKDEGIQLELSVSLHAANDKLRNELVPANRKYPIEKLTEVLKEYFKETGRVVTLEYTLIKSKNDLPKNADELIKIARELKAKVNLITCNPFPGEAWRGSDKGVVTDFRDTLIRAHVAVTIRKPRGWDILASCGQLAAKKR